MSHKEKLEEAKRLYETANADQKYVLESLFPELKESDDERIRKALIGLVQEFYEQTSAFYKEVSVKDILIWLEKQGQVKKSLISQHENKICKESDDSLTSEDERIRKELLSFFTERAKYTEDSTFNGLSSKEIVTWLEKQAEQKPLNKIKIGKEYKCIASPIYTAFIKGNIYKPEDEFVCSLMNFCSDCFEPIEDNEKKPTEEYNITGIKSKHAQGKLGEMIKKLEIEKQSEQKPIETVKWSPQEESCICQLESLVKEQWRQAERVHNSVNIKKMSELMFFLKTLNPNKKLADKVEPKFKVGDTITDPTDSTFTFHINAIKDGKYMESDKDWILIKEADSDYELVEQKTIKWSEEDKNHVKSILSTIKCCKAQFPNSQAVVEAYNADIEWLKSLKDRYTWKPSEGQLECLGYAIEKAEKDWSPLTNNRIYLTLKALKEQLKKLKGE